MQTSRLGRTGLEISRIAFGCGNVGGLMIRGNPSEQDRAVAHAIANGVSYFDTAAQYGNGQSETNLGRALRACKGDVTIASKLKIAGDQKNSIRPAMMSSLNASLARLGRDHIDLLQLHNTITKGGEKDSLTADVICGEVVPVFQELQQAGKIRFFGMTAMGETEAILDVIERGGFYSAQTVYNLLNPSTGRALPDGYPAQDYRQLLEATERAEMGTICIRVLAGGALRGPDEAHELASKSVRPMGSGSSFDRDRERAGKFQRLIDEGFVDSLPEAAIRYALGERRLTTVAVGLSDFAQLEATLAAAERGVLPSEAVAIIHDVQGALAGEAR